MTGSKARLSDSGSVEDVHDADRPGPRDAFDLHHVLHADVRPVHVVEDRVHPKGADRSEWDGWFRKLRGGWMRR